ncbi:NfeD family protein [Stenoxybacter acetivorans]|uniref:NfeD family protein n=1 Tax=Stenoxybacter acetivorans TaxID=422441 RepID=UPI00056ABC53|nr:NfeD family protein [Stenoxybacter acetivorans]
MYWAIAAVLVFVAEMFVGTFYLLVVSASLLSAGLAEWLFGTSLAVNLLIASLFSVLGIVLVRRWSAQWRKRQRQVSADDPDLGQTVLLEKAINGDLWQVRYRGTQWQGRIQGVVSAGTYVQIVGKEGSCLLLARLPE